MHMLTRIRGPGCEAKVHTLVHFSVHRYIDTYIHTHIYTYIHTYTHIYIHTYTHFRIHTYICTKSALVYVCLRAYTHAYMS